MRRVLAALLILAGCAGDGDGDGDGGRGGDDGGRDALVVAAGMAVLDAWTRPSPPTVDEAAIYVTVENRDAPDDRLVGAASDRCVVVTPHLTQVDEDDVARMTEADADQLGLRAGDRVTMSPNGMHLMCLGLTTPLADGERFDLTLQFADHAPVTVAVAVEQR